MAAEVLSFHGGAPAPPASRLLPPRSDVRWFVLLYETQGFGAITWPRGIVECRTRTKAFAVGRTLAADYNFGCMIDALDILTGEILESYEYGYL